MKLRAIVFDLFGTLADIASLQAAAAAYTEAPAAFVATWREKQLGYAFAATMMNRYADFDALTLRALRYAAARHGLAAGGAWEELAAQWCRVAPFADAKPALMALRAAGVPLAVLTNGTAVTARAALAAADLLGLLDEIISVDEVRAYKPDPRVYALATARFAAAPDEIVFVTANGWDATGAAEFGLTVAWCNRAQAPAETFGAPPAYRVASLDELPALLARHPVSG